jgi:chromosome segregation ATPase
MVDEKEVKDIIKLVRLSLRYDDLVKVTKDLKAGLTKLSGEAGKVDVSKELAEAEKSLEKKFEERANKLVRLFSELEVDTDTKINGIIIPDIVPLREELLKEVAVLDGKIGSIDTSNPELVQKIVDLKLQTEQIEAELNEVRLTPDLIEKGIERAKGELQVELLKEIKRLIKFQNTKDAPFQVIGVRNLPQLGDISISGLADNDILQ